MVYLRVLIVPFIVLGFLGSTLLGCAAVTIEPGSINEEADGD